MHVLGTDYIIIGLVYTYLAGHARRCSNSEGPFRALKRGYTHWASGRLKKIEVNTNHPGYCHVRSTTTPSMKSGMYKVYLLLKHDIGPSSNLSMCCWVGNVHCITQTQTH